MDFIDRAKSEYYYGPEITLDDSTIKRMFKLVNLGKKDVFYDLGSGNGNIVRKAVIWRNVKKAHGIEFDLLRFQCAVQDTKLLLDKKQLKRIEFWRAKFEKFDFNDATVVYDGLTEQKKDVDMYNRVFKKKAGVKIIKQDLPLVGYKPVQIDRKNPKKPLFLMQTPLEDYKIDKKEWIRSIVRYGTTINDVYSYYRKLLNNYLEPPEREKFIKDLKDLVENRF